MRKLDKRAVIAAAAAGLALVLATPGYAADTIKIGVIAEAQAGRRLVDPAGRAACRRRDQRRGRRQRPQDRNRLL